MNDNTQEPIFETQLNEDGVNEKIDITKYSLRILCTVIGCLRVRYVKPQDKHKVNMCKPHARTARLAKRAERARDKRKQGKAIPE